HVRATGDCAHDGDQQHRLGAEHVACQDAVIVGRPYHCADHGQGHHDEDCGGCCDIHAQSSRTLTRLPILPLRSPRAVSSVRAWISSTFSTMSRITVPGVILMELAYSTLVNSGFSSRVKVSKTTGLILGVGSQMCLTTSMLASAVSLSSHSR